MVLAEKRKALKAALDHLKGEPAGQKEGPAATQPAAMMASRGSITLQELRLPLKADFVCSTANKPGTHAAPPHGDIYSRFLPRFRDKDLLGSG